MAFKERTLAFVLKKKPLKEADEIFTLFTKDYGKIEVVGKGIRKITSKLRAAMDIFYLSEIEFVQGKNQKTLTDALLKEKFLGIRKNLKKLSGLYKMVEVLDGLIKGEETDEKIWKFILRMVYLLERARNEDKIINLWYEYFFWNFISLLGSKPEVDQCVVCQRKFPLQEIYFSSKEGGILCQNCFQKIKKGKKINTNLRKILRLLFEKNFYFLERLKIKREEIKILREISEDYFRFLGEKKYEEENSFT